MNTLGDRIRELRKRRNLTQTELAEKCGWDSGQARIGNYEKGRRSPSIEDLRTLAAALDVGLWDLLATSDSTIKEGAVMPYTPDNFVVINQYKSSVSIGRPGNMNSPIEASGGLAFKRAWLQRRGLNPANLHVIYVHDSSMETTISNGDAVLMDDSQTEPKNNVIYIIRRTDGEILIKRLIRSLTGSWIVRSDNDDKRQYPDFELTDSAIAELTILGRVVWHGGDL